MTQGEMQGGAVERTGDPASVVPLGAEATARSFARAMLAREPRAAASHLAPDAHLITPDGTEIIGRGQIVAVLEQITASVQPLEIRSGRAVVAGPIAFCTQFWRRGGPGGSRHEASSTARLVLTRAAGRWEIAIASPWERAGGR
jgi:ketosteroid isomerase-like protein